MHNWSILEDVNGHMEMLSSLRKIINITDDSPLSLRESGLDAVNRLIAASTCPHCSLVFVKAQLPETLKKEINKKNNGASLVSCSSYCNAKSIHVYSCVQYMCTCVQWRLAPPSYYAYPLSTVML